MAIKRANRGFIGLSTDTKPTTRVRPLSIFNETDTGKTFTYVSGPQGSGWVLNTQATGPTGPTGANFFA